MSFQLLIGGRDYSIYVNSTAQQLAIQWPLNKPQTLQFALLSDSANFNGLGIPEREEKVVVHTNKFGNNTFIGFVSSHLVRDLSGYLPVIGLTKPVFGLKLVATSEEFQLNSKSSQLVLLPPVEGRKSGAIIRMMTEFLLPDKFTYSFDDDDGEFQADFEIKSGEVWSDIVGRLATNDRYHYWVLNGVIGYAPLGDAALGVTYDLTTDSTVTGWNVANMSVEPKANAIKNDIIMLGGACPRGTAKAFFVGDGYQGNFYLRNHAFGIENYILVNENWQNGVNASVWEKGPGTGFVEPSLGNLQINGGSGLDSSFVRLRKGIELSGSLRLIHGEVQFSTTSFGLMGCLYRDFNHYNVADVVFGYRIVPSSEPGDTDIQGVVNGAAVGDILTSQPDHSYVLVTNLHARKIYPWQSLYRSVRDPDTSYGGEMDPSWVYVTFEVWDYDITNNPSVAPATIEPTVHVLYTGLVDIMATLTNPFLAYIVVQAIDMHLAINFTEVAYPFQMQVQTKKPVFDEDKLVTIDFDPTVIRPVGFGVDRTDATVSTDASGHVLQFYPTPPENLPVAGEVIDVSFHLLGQAIGRVQDPDSIADIAAKYGEPDDGLRTLIVENYTPILRSDEDARNAAAALLTDSVQVDYQATYTVFSTYATARPLPGRMLFIKDDERFEINPTNLLVAQVDLSIYGDLLATTDIHQVTLRCGTILNSDVFAALLRRGGTALDQQFTGNLPALPLDEIDSAYLPVEINDWGVSPYGADEYEVGINDPWTIPANYSVEVRKWDRGWGPSSGGYDPGLILRTAAGVKLFRIPRTHRDQYFYMRFVVGAVTSAKSAYCRIGWPLLPESVEDATAYIDDTGHVRLNFDIPDIDFQDIWRIVVTSDIDALEDVYLTFLWDATTFKYRNLVIDAPLILGESLYISTFNLFGERSAPVTVVIGEGADVVVPPGDVTLGEPNLTWEIKSDAWYAVITIPVTAPEDDENFDRMFVFLQAPDDATPTSKATISSDTPGFYIDNDPETASRVVSISEPEVKIEVKWNPEEPIIRISHPEPMVPEPWRVLVVSGSPYYTNPQNRADEDDSTPSVLLTVTPHPLGAHGEEYCPNARDVGVTVQYFLRAANEQWWRPKVVWNLPEEDPRWAVVAYWDIIVFNPTLPDLTDTPQDDRYVIASTEDREKKQWTGLDDWRVPDEPVLFEFWVNPKTMDGHSNTLVQGVVGMARITVQRQASIVAAVLTFEATWEYRIDDTTGRKILRIRCVWTKPDDLSYAGITIYMLRSDYADLGYVPQTGVMVDTETEIWFDPFPVDTVTVTLRPYTVDSDGNLHAWEEGDPEVILSIEPPSVAVPVGNVTGFSVAYVYLAPDYYGKTVLRLTPTFTRPVGDASWAFAEFWAKREDGVWYLLGYPAKTGDFALVEHLPNVAFDWEFKMVSQDVDSRNRDGAVSTDTTAFPTGTASFTLNILPPTGKLKGPTIENIPAAAFAAGLTGIYLGTSLPAMPNATLYPPGTPFVLTATNPPKLYRANSTGTGWTAQTDGADITARSIFGTSLVVGAVGTVELAATEILVGPGSNRPVRFVVRDTDNTLLAMIGDDSTVPYKGAYFRNIKIAPGILSTDRYIMGSGTALDIRGATFQTVVSGVRAEVGNVITLPVYGTQAGLRVCADTNTNQAVLLGTRQIMIMNGTTGNRSISMDSVTGYGIFNAYDAGGVIRIQLNADFGTVFADSGYYGASSLRLLHGQRASIPTSPTGGGVIDVQARATIDQIIDRLRNHHTLWI